MKTPTTTPYEEYDKSIANAKATYNVAIKRAKARLKFRISSAEDCAKQIDVLIKQQRENWAESFYNEEIMERRIKIAQCLLKKDIVISCYVRCGSYFSMSTMRTANEHYNIVFKIRNQEFVYGVSRKCNITLVHKVDYSSRPSDEEILTIAQGYFPSVKRINVIS